MQLSRLLGLRVIDAGSHPVGTVIDVRLTIAGDASYDPPTPRVLGLIISPHTTSSYLGYERTEAKAPKMLAALLRWRHRDTFLARWEDVARLQRITSGCDRATPRTPRCCAIPTDRAPFSVPGGGEPDSCAGKSQRNLEIQPCNSGKVSMTEKNSGPQEGVKGVVEDVKGKAKEAAGTVTGRDDLVREGKAQQDKADAQQDAAKKEAEAESARAGAKAAEKRQQANQ